MRLAFFVFLGLLGLNIAQATTSNMMNEAGGLQTQHHEKESNN